MLTLQDCLDFCQLTEAEVDTIARHEHLPEIVAAARDTYLLLSDKGINLIKCYMLEDIEDAELHGLPEKARHLRWMVAHFSAAHPAPDPA